MMSLYFSFEYHFFIKKHFANSQSLALRLFNKISWMKNLIFNIFIFFGLAITGCSSKLYVKLEKSQYSRLNNWQQDNHKEALDTFLKSCGKSKKFAQAQIFQGVSANLANQAWKETCKIGKNTKNPKLFFEKNFTPFLVKDRKGEKGLFTGYYEVEIEGSLVKTSKHTHPVYLHSAKHNIKHPRSLIEKGALKGKKLEACYVSDKVGLFFMHIQGSGKIKIGPNSYLKLAYASQNGYPYYAIGNYLTKNNLIDKNNASAESIINWLNKNPKKAAEIMNLNESYIFFKIRHHLHPVGAMGVEVTPMRTLAVDKRFIPLGIPLWLETTYPVENKKQSKKPFNRLMVAQDVGGAIKGAIRGDIFFGSDKRAERYAWYMKNMGKYYVLVPNSIANKIK